VIQLILAENITYINDNCQLFIHINTKI